MAYDEAPAPRIREHAAGEPVEEKRMFGGLAFLLGGHMAVAASGQGGLMLRVDPGETQTLLGEPHVAPMVMRGRELNGWLRVDATGLDDATLETWVRRGVTYAQSLPPK